ncbi:MAG: phosphoenolpyruvate--protein phosphotransferase [Alphaproteobacteria bacterium]|nr:phosphoenolpyruvate--protein phosphotransferase [Alphaproteobacteria bacterium]
MALRAAWAGSRLLLRRLRDVMAGSGSAQDRLNRIVGIIARDMVAEVCSIYARRAGDVIELFATEGLKSDAVHSVRFRFGEGIVGVVAATARPIALADAQSHPDFAFRPETGEQNYSSMLGVPVLRGGRVLGVLAIQNRTRREYAEEEIETLETVGMVVAELLAGGELVSVLEQQPTDGLGLAPLRLEGVRLSPGLAMGAAVLHQPAYLTGDPVAEDETVELQRLHEAIDAMHSALDGMIERYGSDQAGDHLDILRTYRMFAEDQGWIRRIREAIGTGLTAEAAVIRVQSDMRARMALVKDAYIQERLSDFEDLTGRLIQHLAGETAQQAARQRDLPEDAILVARNMGPADLLDYEDSQINGVVLEEGSAAAHVAIVAKALDIPVVGRITGAMTRIEPGDRLVVDGANGVCFVRPNDDFQRTFARSMALHAERKAAYARDAALPSVTKDGVPITLNMNAGLLIDLPHLREMGGAGIGLYRTEVPFMVRSEFPDVAAQERLYTAILEQSDGKPVVFRTLDIGGDKIPTYIQEMGEENPAMGWRAVRIGLDRPALLRAQLRALVQASSGRPLYVMFPMIAQTAEMIRARALVDIELERAVERGLPGPSLVRVGAMLEVPSLAYQLASLKRHVDFLSVGSNDLLQFLFASDRGNPKLDGRYDPLSPAMLGMLKSIAETCRTHEIELSLCGEMAGSPVDAMALIGLGYRTLSMNATAIGPVRALVRSIDAGAVTELIESHLQSGAHSLRSVLKSYAVDRGVQI